MKNLLIKTFVGCILVGRVKRIIILFFVPFFLCVVASMGVATSEEPLPTCLAGEYLSGSICVVCPAGQYKPLSGNESCTLAPQGAFVPNSGMTNYNNCAIGTYQDLTGQSSCNNCAIGTYQDLTGQSSCNDCAQGAFSELGATSCTACQAGEYVLNGGSCVTCPPGNYCPELLSDVIPCPKGKYCPAAGLSAETEASECDPGYYCPDGSVNQLECTEGFYCLGSDNDPILCTKGVYCPLGSQEEINCEPGYYCDIDGLVDHKICTAGYYCPAVRTVNPLACEIEETEQSCAGYLSEEECPPIRQGYYCPEGAMSKTGCESGYYCDQDKLVDPKICPIGKYCPDTYMTTPIDCEPGYYCDIAGLVDHKICPTGSYCPSANMTAPIGCEPGNYCYGEGLSRMESCPFGHYCPDAEMENPIACPKNKTTQGEKAISVNDCIVNAETAICVPGEYYNPDSRECAPCVEGYYCHLEAMQAPVGCNKGTYCPLGSVTETICPVGYYCPQARLSDAIICDAGYYCPTDGMVTKVICPQGSYCPIGSVNPVGCPNGTLSVEGISSSSDCNLSECPFGQYLEKDVCTACPSGYYCQFSTKMPCGQGNYCPDPGATEPTACPIGNYCPEEEMTEATSCRQGNICPEEGMSVPRPCVSGQYCPDRGMIEGLTCPRGSYCSSAGMSMPFKCPTATYGMVEGGIDSESVCMSCPSNMTSNPGSISCTTCVDGKYLDQDSGLCDLCSTNYYCQGGEVIQCDVDKPYAFLGAKSEDECVVCPEGYCCNTGKMEMFIESMASINKDKFSELSSITDAELDIFNKELFKKLLDYEISLLKETIEEIIIVLQAMTQEQIDANKSKLNYELENFKIIEELMVKDIIPIDIDGLKEDLVNNFNSFNVSQYDSWSNADIESNSSLKNAFDNNEHLAQLEIKNPNKHYAISRKNNLDDIADLRNLDSFEVAKFSQLRPNQQCDVMKGKLKDCPENHCCDIEGNVNEKSAGTVCSPIGKVVTENSCAAGNEEYCANSSVISLVCKDQELQKLGTIPWYSLTHRSVRCVAETIRNILQHTMQKIEEGRLVDYCIETDAVKQPGESCTGGAIAGLQQKFSQFVQVTMLLFVVLYTFMFLMNQTEIKSSELIVKGIKIAFVVYFATGNAWKDGYLDAILDTGSQFGSIVMNAAADASARIKAQKFYEEETGNTDDAPASFVEKYSDKCVFNYIGPTGKSYSEKGKRYRVWDVIDCKLKNYYGFVPTKKFYDDLRGGS